MVHAIEPACPACPPSCTISRRSMIVDGRSAQACDRCARRQGMYACSALRVQRRKLMGPSVHRSASVIRRKKQTSAKRSSACLLFARAMYSSFCPWLLGGGTQVCLVPTRLGGVGYKQLGGRRCTEVENIAGSRAGHYSDAEHPVSLHYGPDPPVAKGISPMFLSAETEHGP